MESIKIDLIIARLTVDMVLNRVQCHNVNHIANPK